MDHVIDQDRAGKPSPSRPCPYLGGRLVVAGVITFLLIKAADTDGFLDSGTELANRVTTLYNAYVETYNTDSGTIGACQSVNCEKAPRKSRSTSTL